MGLFKGKGNKNILVQDEAETNNILSQTIDIEINSENWEETAKGLRGDESTSTDCMLFEKLGFKSGDKIQIFSVEVSEEINERVPQWTRGNEKLLKSFFKINSAQKGEFILGVCTISATLINEDLTVEKQYQFTFSKLDHTRLDSEKNIVCNSNIKLEILYRYDELSIICEDVKANGQSIKLKFSLAHDTFSCFEDAKITEARITKVKEESAEIRRQLLELREIPTHENNDGVIKLFNEISLNDFFGENIVLKEIILTAGGREDTVEFEDKKVKGYQINDLVRGTKRKSSNGYSLVSGPSYVIETSSRGTNIKMSEVSKEAWLNGSEQFLSEIVPAGVIEQRSMEDLLTKVEGVAVKSLQLGNSNN